MNVNDARSASQSSAVAPGSSRVSTRKLPSLFGEPPCVEHTSQRRTNDPRYVLRVVDRVYTDGRIARSSALIEVASGHSAGQMDVVSYDEGATWERH